MKTWLAKFKISNALNERRPLPGDAEAARALDQLLKKLPSTPAVSESQHAAIMRAVRTAEITPKFSWPRMLVPATTTALVIFIAAAASLNFHHQTPNNTDSPLALATAALQTREALAQTFPAATQPLTDELALLNRDATNAQNFILASLP